jgi:6-phosphogluconate dehydrogenase
MMLAPFFVDALSSGQHQWREVVAFAARGGIPIPSISAALSYFDAYRCRRLPANLLQAQRDFFGAHSFERTDQPEGEFFHHPNWPTIL